MKGPIVSLDKEQIMKLATQALLMGKGQAVLAILQNVLEDSERQVVAVRKRNLKLRKVIEWACDYENMMGPFDANGMRAFSPSRFAAEIRRKVEEPDVPEAECKPS